MTYISARRTGKTTATLITLIHVAKRELKLSDETYRDMLFDVTGKESLRAMTVAELEKVINHMKAHGFTVRHTNQDVNPADDPQSKLIRSLWLQLADLGAVKNRSEKALNSFVEGQTKVSALQFLSSAKASLLIERLKQWLKRAQAKQVKGN